MRLPGKSSTTCIRFAQHATDPFMRNYFPGRQWVYYGRGSAKVVSSKTLPCCDESPVYLIFVETGDIPTALTLPVRVLQQATDPFMRNHFPGSQWVYYGRGSTSLSPADVDVDDDANANPRVTDPSTSTSAQGIKLAPVIKTETAPETAPTNTSTDPAEASIPTEPVINGPNLNYTVTVRRKVAKRTDPLYIAPPPPNIAAPLPPSAPAEEIPVIQEPRAEDPLPTITVTDEAARDCFRKIFLLLTHLLLVLLPWMYRPVVEADGRPSSHQPKRERQSQMIPMMPMLIMSICQALPFLLTLP
jgi:hypothetical protein